MLSVTRMGFMCGAEGSEELQQTVTWWLRMEKPKNLRNPGNAHKQFGEILRTEVLALNMWVETHGTEVTNINQVHFHMHKLVRPKETPLHAQDRNMTEDPLHFTH